MQCISYTELILQSFGEVEEMNFKSILKSTVIAFVFICICLCVSAALVYYNVIPQQIANIAIFAATVVGTFIGAFIVAKVSDEKVLFNSLAVGILLSVIVFITAIIINNSPSLHPRTLALICSILGASVIGAISGNR